MVEEPRAGREGWGVALGKALLVLGAAYLGFALVPDRFMSFLATRASPAIRDLFVAAWVVVWFVVLAVGFVALQRPRRG